MAIAVILVLLFLGGVALLMLPAIGVSSVGMPVWLRAVALVGGAIVSLVFAFFTAGNADADGMNTGLVLAVPAAGGAVAWVIQCARLVRHELRR